jgi:hypothetical protein
LPARIKPERPNIQPSTCASVRTYVDFVRDGVHSNGAARMGNARWRRLTEER